ncbi:Rft-1-domain-containing protein [Gloeophyllum trabeum ATCC 11539]|uniref:Man(5)GlcNAc(2)-PP-dolichol translocation protein RFT1 n=1 Tax=Gloeophyllum trabeum (strain ATCC 11539 / FP-39264 / Madison 617) TaxID=670483 RepID=S7RS09_GLOTA|nr:Rft-1-domain-containing protein [Gloeophyllum trabeum ATCC 11539]EPQ55804.1 Rft-1-domain-containing protein [Gloeophyllum trabeum ATCC 11539]
MGLQLSVRLVTFTLNQALLRMTSPRAFGTAAIHFELLLSTILFLSREGVRNTLLRVWPSPTNVPKSMSNLTYLPMMIGVPLALTTSFLYWQQSSSGTRDQPHFELSIITYALAALIELMSEPMHIRAMGELRTNVRVRAEAVGVIGKAMTTFLLLFIDSKRQSDEEKLSLVAFAMGQLMYAILVLIMYLVEYPMSLSGPKSMTALLSPKHIRSAFDKKLLRLSLTMTSQSVVKHVLTEGDKLIVSRLSPLDDQGGYAVAVNYGSLFARIIFQPIEETLRVYFSKLLPNLPNASKGSDLQSLTQASNTLTLLLNTQLSFSAILLTFGVPYLPVFLRVLLPPLYLATSAARVLQAWLWYMPVLAVNGGLEAFVSSVANPADFNNQSRWMTAFSVLYVLSALGFYSLGFRDTFLVYANIINLLSRIAYCASFISAYFRSHSSAGLLRWKYIVPDSRLLLTLALSVAAIRWHAQHIGVEQQLESDGKSVLIRKDMMIHVGLGIGLGLVSLFVWWFRIGRQLLRSRHAKSD